MRLMMEDIDQLKSRLITMEQFVFGPPNPMTPAAASLALTGVAPTVNTSGAEDTPLVLRAYSPSARNAPVSIKGMVKPPGDGERLG